ncbi:ADP-sugar pyrophosphatase-like isoform X3 [Sinocyclocheilus rhinocerous]|uniref:ADP-sugar pyrophosphatase-like isoform X3 n=1 Tax=Sinocyclocheilus rhinocerous TaxID=307959 RepID=UPI0007B990D5|nr:PREDICTED: ADP-sugar pyrophosphatase-like isoform X3 [Sinocyclocheilus rhinocerous]
MSSPKKATTEPHVIKEELIASGKWVKLEKTTYVDPSGSTRTWETAKRTTRVADSAADGLIDDNESVETAALRELKEETGYKGEVVGITSVTCLDPGLSNCTTQMVMVHINGDDIENINPTQQLGDGEFVEVILLPLDEFQQKIDELLQKEKIVVDSKVYIYAMGMSQAFFKPRELPVLKQ